MFKSRNINAIVRKLNLNIFFNVQLIASNNQNLFLEIVYENI